MRFIALATLLSGCTTVMCPGGPAYPIEKSACDARNRSLAATKSARIVKFEQGREEVPFVIVHVEFTNDSSVAEPLDAYGVTWSGGTKRVTGLALIIPPNSKVERALRVDPGDGDLHLIESTAIVQW